jgi:hypothetical protein
MNCLFIVEKMDDNPIAGAGIRGFDTVKCFFAWFLITGIFCLSKFFY